MKTGTYNIDLGFNQILDLVRQLPKKEKIRLSKELEREINIEDSTVREETVEKKKKNVITRKTNEEDS